MEIIKNATSFIIHLQIPVLIFIVYFCFEAYSKVYIAPFKRLMLGWLFNLLYILVNIVLVYWSSDDNRMPVIVFTLFDLLSSFFILTATRVFIDKKWSINRIIPYGDINLSFGFLIIFIFKIYEIYTSNFMILVRIFETYINVIAGIGLVSYFYIVGEKYKIGKTLFFGALVYTGIQIFAFIFVKESANPNELSEKVINLIGFSLGLTSKSLIVFGLQKVFVHQAVELENERKLSKKLTTFIGRTFHEIARPIEAISGETQDILSKKNEKNISNKLHSQLEIVEYSINHIQAIINSTTSFSIDNEDAAVNSYEGDTEYQYMSINTIAQRAIMMLKRKTAKEIQFQYEYGGNCNLYCRTTDIYQICINLLQNAIDAVPNVKGKILIRTKSTTSNDDKGVMFIVEDNGYGVEKSIGERIFEEGFSTKQTSTIGRGFGLAVVKEIVKKYSGTIEFDSEVTEPTSFDKYSTKFCVKLPFNFKKL